MKGVLNDTYALSFFDFLYKSICCGYSFKLPRLIGAHAVIRANTVVHLKPCVNR